MLYDSIEHLFQVGFMLLNRVAEDEYIVQVYMDEYSDEVLEYQSHNPLKGGWCVAVTLLHYMANHGAKDRGECCFQHIVWVYAYLFIRVRKIDLRSIFRSSHVEPDLVLIRERSHILYGIIVAFTTVYDCPQCFTIFFGDAEHWRCLGDTFVFPPAGCFILRQLVQHLHFQRIWALRVVIPVNLFVVHKVYFVVDFPERG